MKPALLRTPVALFIFNRPDTAERVFAEIARARPATLLVIGDGPRVDRPGEAERVAESRAILNAVDWDCDVLTNFSDVNLGCRRRVSSGIDWVFESVEEAIILEDDCLPDPSFFRFCEELLERYRGDLRISQIGGTNLQGGYRLGDDSYYFSNRTHVWGWASWSDRWDGCYDVSMRRWPEIRSQRRVADLVGSEAEARHWMKVFDRVYRGEIDTWDYQWGFACMVEGRLSVIPAVNLISNIGFREDATHTHQSSPAANLPTSPMDFPLRHPVATLRCSALDLRYFRRYEQNTVRQRLRRRIHRLVGGGR